MREHKIILIAEALLLLVPVSILALFGGGYILTLQLFEKIRFQPLSAILIIIFTSILLLSLISLWSVLIHTIKNNAKALSPKRITSFFTHVGAILSMLILASWVFSNIFIITNTFVNTVIIYLPGALALIPYLHLLFLNGGSFTKIANN